MPLEDYVKGTVPQIVGQQEVAAIRAYKPGEDVARVRRWLNQWFGASDIYVVVDQTYGKRYIWPAEYNVITYDEEFLTDKQLFNPGRSVGWRCGDYSYIALRDSVAFSHAWLVEPDVAANFDIGVMLSDLEGVDADLISVELRKRDHNWSWYQPMKATGHDDVRSAFFPFTRLSAPLIDFVYEERRRSEPLFTSGELSVYPNDEAVIGTVASACDCSSYDLKDAFPGMFSHFLWGAKWLYPDVLNKFDGLKLVHPVLHEDQYSEYLRKVIRDNSRRLDLKQLATSMWSIRAKDYRFWNRFVLDEIQRSLDHAVFNR